MKRGGPLLLLLAVACSTSRQQPQAQYEAAALLFRQGNLPLAQQRVEASLQKNPDESEWICKLRLLRAELLLAQGRAKEALPVVEQSVCKGPEDSALRLRRLVARADALSKLDRHSEALALIEQAASRAGDSDIWLQSQVLKGAILARTSRTSEAEMLLKRVVDLAARENNEYQRAAALINLSFSRIRQYRFDEALGLSKQALEASERAQASRFAALSHNNLGISYARLGDFERAGHHRSLAVKSLREIDDRRNLQDALGELGNLQVLLGKPQDAIAPFEQAFGIARDLRALSPASRWAGNLALVLIGANRWDDAERWNREAQKLKEQVNDRGGLVFLRLNAAAIAAGREQFPEGEKLLREVIVDGKAIPFLVWQAHAMLARLYADSGQFAKANAEFEKGLQAIEEVRSDLLQSDFKLTFLARLIGFFQQYVDALMEQGQSVRALQVAEYSRARVLAERLGSSQQKIAAVDAMKFQEFARAKRATLVSYWLAPRRSFVWVVRPEGIQHAVLPGEGKITELVASFRRLVEEELRDPVTIEGATARRLGELLLGDVIKLVPAGSRVFVVPDGALHRINLETLPVPGVRRYLLEDWAMCVAPSLSVLAGERTEVSRKPARLLLVGASEGQGTEYPALSKAGDEIQSIQEHFAGAAADVYTGAKATPGAFRNSHPERFSLIHFAAHAEANPQTPLESAVILSREGGQFKLYARDVTDTKLTADLVTISACRSAGARAYGGEGLVGFAWAFLQAGSRAVIAGLWDVSDSSTAVLMDRLYERMASGEAPESALRSAKLSLLKGTGPFRKPYYWGPLQAYVRAAPR